ncbi:MAG: L,D-transpeptidase family protein [Candidatus Kerfeldbacteria bacterium]|nr:L,D-transpeptidase family protein [Candidatus Kerfeldbacteria bacterium]
MRHAPIALFFAMGFFVFMNGANGAHAAPQPVVRIWNGTGNAVQREFFTTDASDTAGVRVAVGDLGGDGTNEIVTAPGPGGDSTIRVFRSDGSLITSFAAYASGYNRGVLIATGDLDGDGRDEIITGTDVGAGPHVRVFNGRGESVFTPGFFAYDDDFRGGVSVAAGDVNGDGRDEIITGAGPGGGPHVRVFDRFGKYLGVDFFPFSTDYRGGVNVATTDVDGDGTDEIIMAVNQASAPAVKVYRADAGRSIVGSFYAYPESMRFGVQVAGADIDGDGNGEVVTAPRHGASPHVRIFHGDGHAMSPGFFAFDQGFRHGVSLASGRMRGQSTIVAAQNHQATMGRTDIPKYVVVDLSEQRLYAYEQGMLVRTFLVSTGLPATPTPVGTYKVYQKIYSHLYAGPGYYLPNTLYNLRYNGPLFLHGAYWHNNFGRPMSHGCTNISYENAEWLYNWGDIGLVVINQQ